MGNRDERGYGFGHEAILNLDLDLCLKIEITIGRSAGHRNIVGFRADIFIPSRWTKTSQKEVISRMRMHGLLLTHY